jgi:hypothetical protein
MNLFKSKGPFVMGELYFNQFRNTLRRDNELNKNFLNQLNLQVAQINTLTEPKLIEMLNKYLRIPAIYEHVDDGRLPLTEKARAMIRKTVGIIPKDPSDRFKINKMILMEIYPEETNNIPVSYYLKNFIDGKKIYAFCFASMFGFYYTHFKRGLFSLEFSVTMIWVCALTILIRSTIAKIYGHKLSRFL